MCLPIRVSRSKGNGTPQAQANRDTAPGGQPHGQLGCTWRITQIVMGQSPRSRGRALLGRSLAEKLQQRLLGRHVDLHLIADEPGSPLKPAT